jgi:pimeloyl-ACP methyl ester carboxylesterase
MEVTINQRRAYVAPGERPIDPNLETVVFVHGSGQDHTVWVLPIRYFIRHDRNVLAVDLPGHGRSEGPPLDSIEEMANWIIEIIDAVGVDRAAIVGHSMGTLVALEAAATHPDRIRSIAMVGTSVPLPVSEELLEKARINDHAALDMLTYWSHSTGGEMGGNPTPGIWIIGNYMRLLERAAPGTIYSGLKACHDYLTGLERAGDVSCPTLLLLGERDSMTPTRAAAAVIEALPNATTVVFEGAGHDLLAERPDPVLDELIKIV